MGKIKLLDKTVYNRISAGEVVENPASIVKELAENAIDAGADSLVVSIEDGGIKSVSVVDNGTGMEKEDLDLAIMPHATSKISLPEDLGTIGTLGFRGEALASVAAVSDMTIKSRFLDDDVAHFINVKGGEITERGETALNVGTTVSVRSLFYNTPARFKFLKSRKCEENNVTRLMEELIFANPDVRIEYFADGKQIFKSPGTDLEGALNAIYGEIAPYMLPVSSEKQNYKVNGFIAAPMSSAVQNNRNKQVFIVNGRVIEDATLSAVCRNAYGEYIMKRTFPAVVLDIVMPFELVDVNVHPSKREVRFADIKTLSGIVYRAAKDSIDKQFRLNRREIISSLLCKEMEEYKKNCFGEEDLGVAASKAHYDTSVLFDHTDELFSDDENTPSIFRKNNDVFDNYNFNLPKSPLADLVPDVSDKIFLLNDDDDDERDIGINARLAFSFADNNHKDKDAAAYKIVGQVFDTYLLIEAGEVLYFIDQHAVHERILFDKLIETYNKTPITQPLMVPYAVSVDDDTAENLRDVIPVLTSMGFQTELKNDNLKIYGVPPLVRDIDITKFTAELLENCMEGEYFTSELLKDKIAKIACKRAIKGGTPLSNEEISAIIPPILDSELPLQCPHGRPTTVKITKYELEKLFGRKV